MSLFQYTHVYIAISTNTLQEENKCILGVHVFTLNKAHTQNGTSLLNTAPTYPEDVRHGWPY